jgi:hypothetical protein
MDDISRQHPVSQVDLIGGSCTGTGISGDVMDMIDAVLEGAPATFPAELRQRRVAPSESKIKVPHYGGYDHFEREMSDASGSASFVFRWTGRTHIAE